MSDYLILLRYGTRITLSEVMLIWLVLDHFLHNSSSNNGRLVKSFTGGVAPSLLLGFIAVVGLLLLYIVVKHAFTDQVAANADFDLDDDSCDDTIGLEWKEQKN